jgi:hypothetical protein
METSEGGVVITSSTTIPKNQDVVIEWKTDDPYILGFEIRIGRIAGQWDVISRKLGKDLREIRLSAPPQDMTPLFVEFGYIISSDATKQDHESTENVLLSEEPLVISRT